MDLISSHHLITKLTKQLCLWVDFVIALLSPYSLVTLLCMVGNLHICTACDFFSKLYTQFLWRLPTTQEQLCLLLNISLKLL